VAHLTRRAALGLAAGMFASVAAIRATSTTLTFTEHWAK
jgi:hypothetical protein